MLLLAVTSAHPSASQVPPVPIPSFAALARSGESAVLLDEQGECLWAQRGPTPPRKLLCLAVDPGSRKLISIARWRSEWLGADGTERVRRFGPDGKQLGLIVAPVPVADIAASRLRIWAHGLFESKDGTILWHSDDGRSFQPAPQVPRSPSRGGLSRLTENQAVLSVTSEGDAVLAPLIGPPELYVVRPGKGTEVRRLAYVRSSRRDSLRTAGGGELPVGELSAPVRDILPMANGELLVLRNREDRNDPGGRPVEEKGLRVDRYSPAGSLLATAVLRETARWVLHADDGGVLALSPKGHVLRARFGEPDPGRIVD